MLIRWAKRLVNRLLQRRLQVRAQTAQREFDRGMDWAMNRYMIAEWSLAALRDHVHQARQDQAYTDFDRGVDQAIKAIKAWEWEHYTGREHNSGRPEMIPVTHVESDGGPDHVEHARDPERGTAEAGSAGRREYYLRGSGPQRGRLLRVMSGPADAGESDGPRAGQDRASAARK